MFADIIKDPEMKSSWIRVGPNSNGKPSFEKSSRNRYTGTERRKTYENGGQRLE